MNPCKLPVALEMCKTIMTTAIDNFDRDGYLTMAAFLFGNRVDPSTRKRLPEPGFQVVALPAASDELEKDMVISRLTQLVQETQSAGVGFLAEAWTADVAIDQKHLIIPGRIHEIPGAKEIAYFILEHRDIPGAGHRRMWSAVIHRPVDGRPSMGQFHLVPGDSEFYGRMARMMG